MNKYTSVVFLEKLGAALPSRISAEEAEITRDGAIVTVEFKHKDRVIEFPASVCILERAKGEKKPEGKAK